MLWVDVSGKQNFEYWHKLEHIEKENVVWKNLSFLFERAITWKKKKEFYYEQVRKFFFRILTDSMTIHITIDRCII